MTRRFKFGFVFQVMDTNCSTEEEKEEKEGEGLMPRQVSRAGGGVYIQVGVVLEWAWPGVTSCPVVITSTSGSSTSADPGLSQLDYTGECPGQGCDIINSP